VYNFWKENELFLPDGINGFYGPVFICPRFLILGIQPGGDYRNFEAENKLQFEKADFTLPSESFYLIDSFLIRISQFHYAQSFYLYSFPVCKTIVALERARFKIVGMYCTSCKAIVERQLKGEDAIKRIDIDYLTDTVFVDFEASLIKKEEIKKRLEKSDYRFVRVAY
jgi:Cu+-exporting ATPase